MADILEWTPEAIVAEIRGCHEALANIAEQAASCVEAGDGDLLAQWLNFADVWTDRQSALFAGLRLSRNLPNHADRWIRVRIASNDARFDVYSRKLTAFLQEQESR